MTNVELWMKGVEERRKEEAEPSPAKIHKGLENRHRYVCNMGMEQKKAEEQEHMG